MLKKNICQVCGEPAEKGRYNCLRHKNVSVRALGLAQEIHLLKGRLPVEGIKELALKYRLSVQTVRRHLHNEGYSPVREWGRKKERIK